MSSWVVECTCSNLESFSGTQIVQHDEDHRLSRGDTVYLLDTDESILVGRFDAASESGASREGQRKTVINIDGDGVQSVDTAVFPFPITAGAVSTELQSDIEVAFEYEGEEFQLGDKTGKDQSEESETPETLPSGISLSEVLTQEYDVENRDFSGEKIARNQTVEDRTLRGCDFSDAQLEGITFRGTDLRDADFREANLEDATFNEDVKIQGADFTKAQMNRVTLATDITDSKFTLSVLNDGDFTEAALEGADLSDSYLRRANFSGTNPRRTNFEQAILRCVRTTGAEFERSSFVDADLSEVNFDGARFEDCDFSDAQLTNVNFSGAKMSANDFTNAHMEGSNLSGTTVDRHDFRGADLRNATFTDTSADGSTFEDAILTFADFSTSNLRGARFVGAKADNATFDKAYLSGATFADADLFGSSFSDAFLYGCHLASARVDSTAPFDEICIYERDFRQIFEEHSAVVDRRTAETVSSNEKAASVYRSLEAVMDRNSHTSAALRYAFNRKEAVRRGYKERREWMAWIVSTFSKHIVSHGTQFRRLFLWTSIIIFGSAIVYGNGLLYHGDQLLYVGADGYSNAAVLGLALLFSAYSFTGLGFGEFHPVGIGRLLSVTETGLGILFFALFVYVFTTRASR